MPLTRAKRWEVQAFFFSSRRRHTRYWRDWSSDVCSSDLPGDHRKMKRHVGIHRPTSVQPVLLERETLRNERVPKETAGEGEEHEERQMPLEPQPNGLARDRQIGRASCRERGERAGLAGSV